MRIAFAHWTDSGASGAESYVAAIAEALWSRGHSIAFCPESHGSGEVERLVLPSGAETIPLTGTVEEAIRSVSSWRPDVVFVHGLASPALEQALMSAGRAVLFGHNYYGTCTSGRKAHGVDAIRTCERVFGKGCLTQYYVSRCGGLNPKTLLREHRLQAARASLIPRYERVLTLSQHMAHEFRRHGGQVECVGGVSLRHAVDQPRSLDRSHALRITFVGRLDPTKGGHVLLAALPLVRKRLGREITLDIVGAGNAEPAWRALASQIEAVEPQISVHFAGSLQRESLDAVWRRSDLLVVPSLWPEPFGLVGLEAGAFGVPAAAFGVGGIPEWLEEGVNGHLADPTAGERSLANAIASCLESDAHYAQLSAGAIEATRSLAMDRHVLRVEAALRPAKR